MTDAGYDLKCTYLAQSLEMPDGSFRTTTAVDLALDMAEVSGRICLSQALVRRLVTSRGQLVDVVIPPSPQVANYGTDLTQYVNADMSTREIALVGANVDAELIQDERVVESETVASRVGPLLLVPIDITDGTGPFQLVLSISNVTVQLLSSP